MLKKLRNIASNIIVFSGLNALCGFFLRNSLFVLPYHSIVSVPGRLDGFKEHITFSADEFERQIAYLKRRGHTFLRMNEIAAASRLGIKKPTAIYFDDGYKDNLTVALPILERYSVPATLFVTTGFIDGTDIPWTMGYRSFLKSQDVPEIEWEKRIHALKTLSDNERERAIREEYERSGSDMPHDIKSLFLSWEEIKRLSDKGWEIGSHSVSHVRLSESVDVMLNMELAKSKQTIEHHIGAPVTSVSFPHGRFSDKVIDAVMKNGYSAAVSIGTGLNEQRIHVEPCYFFRNVPVRVGESFASFKANLYFWNLFRPS